MNPRNGAAPVRDLGAGFAQLAAFQQQTLQGLAQLVEVLNADRLARQAVEGQSEIATVEEEYLTQQSASSLTLQPKTSNYFLVQQITWAIPAGATGVITLGDRLIPISTQMQSISARMLLSGSDPRQLNVSTTGQCFLHLAGRILSPWARLH